MINKIKNAIILAINFTEKNMDTIKDLIKKVKAEPKIYLIAAGLGILGVVAAALL